MTRWRSIGTHPTTQDGAAMPAVSTEHARWMTLTQIDDRLRQLRLEPKPRSDLWRHRVDQLLEARTKVTK
jgi:hypothetical protein